jgi:large repetitive protein
VEQLIVLKSFNSKQQHKLNCVNFIQSMSRRVIATIVALALTATQVLAHGIWIGSNTGSTLDYSAATLTLLQNNIAAGIPGFAVGDFIEYQANLPVGVFGTTAGPNGYVTFYPPSGTEVAGAYIVDAAGAPINSSLPGGMSRGWGPRGQNTFFTGLNGWTLNPAACSSAGYTAANCNSGLAYIYGDSGVFYSTHADTAMYTGGGTAITYANGYVVNPTVTTGWTSAGGAGSVRVHNKWDAVQTNAFGANSILANPGFAGPDITQIVTTGRASTPFRSGSPVAGPDSGQMLDRNGVVGPWQRVTYSGSCFANDPTIAGVEGPANGIGSVVPQAAGGAVNSINVCTSTGAGYGPSDATPLPATTKAVRFATGIVTSGQIVRVKVRLKVTNPANIVANFEGHGSDSMQIGTTTNGNDNPWRYWLGAPVSASAASNRLLVNKQIISVNGVAYNGTSVPPNATIRYRVSYANGSMGPQTNVQVSDVLPVQSVSTSNYTVLSGPNITPAVLPSSGTFNFLPIANLAQGAGGAIEFDVATASVLGQTVTN